MMTYFWGFLFCGLVCMFAQVVYDHSKLTPGHITTGLVVLGAFLETMNVYDFLLKHCGMGASIPILSFGHSLAHASYAAALKDGWLGIVGGLFDKTASGISFAIFMACLVALIFKAHD